ncbi:MAG: hypothetical protein JOY80_07210 [Candidatus Dormibacteraeota bacterium]|nr:hypothetical protein [Candidatus Dormibacteraeota bacterium]
MQPLLQISDTQPAVDASQQILASKPSGDTLWAAVFVYMGGGTDASVLHGYLTYSVASIRAMAAAGVTRMGDIGGIPVLIDSLSSDKGLLGSQPPAYIWTFASEMLARFTGQTFGPTYDADGPRIAAAQALWKQWWAVNQSKLRWDSGQQLWVTS